MPYDNNDHAIRAVETRMRNGMDSGEAYYDVFSPNRNNTIGQGEYEQAVSAAVTALGGNFSRCQVQGQAFVSYPNPRDAATAWRGSDGWSFLHIHKAGAANYRVYIPADLRHIAEIIPIVWKTPSLTGFKVAGYLDANNRSDVIIAWVTEIAGVDYIAKNVRSNMLHGMRPPGTSIIRSGCLIGYSQEVPGSSVGTEVRRDIETRI